MSSNFGSRKDIVSIEAVTMITQELSMPRTIQIFLSSMTCWLKRIATTRRGWMILTTSLLASSKAMRILITLRPPPVEPALAPTIISSNRTNWLNTGQVAKSALAYPVLDIEMDWNRACLRATSGAKSASVVPNL